MAKALIGHLPATPGSSSRPVGDVHRLRRRVAELEALVLRLQQENDRLTATQAATMLEGADLSADLDAGTVAGPT